MTEMQVVKLLLMVVGGALMVSVVAVIWTFVIRSRRREIKGQDTPTQPDFLYCCMWFFAGVAMVGVALLIH